MIITKEILIEKDACNAGLEWFSRKYGEDAKVDHKTILDDLSIDKLNYGEWLLKNFELSGIYRHWDDIGQLIQQYRFVDGKIID